MQIQPEQPQDINTIRQLTNAAFKNTPFSNQTEAGIIDALRESKALTLSLVAIENDQIHGHVAFSPITINNQNLDWYGLGPVSVWPERQRQGIGAALINEGLKQLRNLNAKGCVVLGNPEYYQRFGFTCDPNLTYSGAPAEYFMQQTFNTPTPQGEVRYHKAFDGG